MKKKLQNCFSPHYHLGGGKYLKIMKISFLLLAISLCSIQAAVFSQSMKSNLNLTDVTLKEALEALEENSSLKFLYRADLIDINEKINLSVNPSMSLDLLMTRLLRDTKVEYSIINENLVVLSPVKSNQQVKVTGKVIDGTTGDGLAGVTIQIKGTQQGTVTGADGVFDLPIPEANAILIFSFVGYQSQEIAVEGRNSVDVVLKEELTALDEVIVIGYGTQVKSSVTGSVSTVGSKDLENTSVTNVAEALQGKISGVYVTSEGGKPGSGSNIYLRGPMSISGGNPLYVVDGVPVDNLDYSFNMEDIESISVLKDASAASIYGAKAAGGVILVTTKRGKNAKPEISFDGSYGVRNVIKLPNLLNRDDYIPAKRNVGYDVVDLFGPEGEWKNLPNTDWFDEFYNSATEQNYSLSVSGGGDASTYYLSGNYNRIEGTRLSNWIERYTFRVNSDHQLYKRLKLSENIYYKAGTENTPSIPEEGYMTFRSCPIMPVYDPSNEQGGWGMTPRGFQGHNYVAGALTQYGRNKDYSIYLSGSLDYEIIDGLHLKGLFGTTQTDIDSYVYQYPFSDGSFPKLESFTQGDAKLKQYIATYTLNYSKEFNGHKFATLLGYEARRSSKSGLNYLNQSSFVTQPQTSDLAKDVSTLSANFMKTDVLDRILSQFFRLEYSYKNKYLLTANVRRDGYGSKFGPENKYGIFPGVSAGWVLSQEDFLSEYKFITLLKIRAGYGVLGNAVGEDFAYSSYYNLGYNYDWSEGGDASKRETGLSVASKLPNPDIQWEVVATTNLGFDASFWNNRLSLVFDYYSRQTRKMLYNVPLSLSAGVGSQAPANIGQMSNKGFEFSVIHQNNVGDFNYNIAFTGGVNKNKLISLNPDIDRLYIASGNIGANESGGGFYGGATICRSEPGNPLGQFYGLETGGIYSEDAAAGSRPTYSGYTPQKGDLIYVDQNKDGIINTEDYRYIGNPWPKFTMGLTLGGGWKGFDVKASFNGVLGNEIYNGQDSYEHNFFSDYNTTAKIYETSFYGDNGLTSVPRAATLSLPDRNKNWGTVSDYHIQKGSYVRLKNVQVGYTLPVNLMEKIPMLTYMKLYVSADNLLVITKYKGMDPEIPAQGTYGGILAQGIDFLSPRYPISRIISFGVNMRF